MREFDITEAFAEAKFEGQPYGPARGAYEKAQKNAARLHEEVDRLLKRIGPALGPESPLPSDPSGKDVPSGQSEVTNSFFDLGDHLDRAARRISAITSRVEL